MPPLINEQRVVKGKSNLYFVIKDDTIYIQTSYQCLKLDWVDNKKITHLRRLTLLLDCGNIHTLDELFGYVNKTGMKVVNTNRFLTGIIEP